MFSTRELQEFKDTVIDALNQSPNYEIELAKMLTRIQSELRDA